MKNLFSLNLRITLILILFVIISSCSSDELVSLENGDYLSTEESIKTRSSSEKIIYSNLDEDFYLYTDSNLPVEIKERLSKAEYKLLCELSEKKGVAFLDQTHDFKELKHSDELRNILNSKVTVFEKPMVNETKQKSIVSNIPRLKSGSESSTGETIEYISLRIAAFTRYWDSNSITGYVNLNWHYSYDNDSQKAIVVTNSEVVTTSAPGTFDGFFTNFSGLGSVVVDSNRIQFNYAVNGTVYIGVSIGGVNIGLPCFDVNKQGIYLCPL